MEEERSDYDGAWKEALESYFAQFLAFFFPQAHGGIDWSRGYEFLDKELRRVAPAAKLGPRRVDKLAKVWRPGGEEAWVLVHVEVQSQDEGGFAERMYIYHYRLFDRYHRRVASLAVLGDERPGWRPDQFDYELWGCNLGFRFPVVKLLDYREQWQVLEASRNPFATAVMAHLKAQETRRDERARQAWKLSLTRRLYEQGYGQEEVVNLFRFIDWVMQLPEDLDKGFWQEIQAYEEAKQMPYITSVERIGIKKGFEQGIEQGVQQGIQQGIEQGIQQGIEQGIRQGIEQGARQELLEGIELGLELKFGSEGLKILPEICKIEDVDRLRAIREGLKVVHSLEELRRIYQ